MRQEGREEGDGDGAGSGIPHWALLSLPVLWWLDSACMTCVAFLEEGKSKADKTGRRGM